MGARRKVLMTPSCHSEEAKRLKIKRFWIPACAGMTDKTEVSLQVLILAREKVFYLCQNEKQPFIPLCPDLLFPAGSGLI